MCRQATQACGSLDKHSCLGPIPAHSLRLRVPKHLGADQSSEQQSPCAVGKAWHLMLISWTVVGRCERQGEQVLFEGGDGAVSPMKPSQAELGP